MDWDRVKRSQREALARLLATLSALLGAAPGRSPTLIPKATYWAALALLKPLESALRRLVVIHARGMAAPTMPPGTPRPRRVGQARAGTGAQREPLFQLWDRRKRFEPPKFRSSRFAPRITLLGVDDWTPYPQPIRRAPDAPRDASGLCRRLRALERALADPDAQAERLVRWRVRRALMRAEGRRAHFIVPLRPGSAPGYRRRRQRAVDLLLAELDRLARLAEAETAPSQPRAA